MSFDISTQKKILKIVILFLLMASQAYADVTMVSISRDLPQSKGGVPKKDMKQVIYIKNNMMRVDLPNDQMFSTIIIKPNIITICFPKKPNGQGECFDGQKFIQEMGKGMAGGTTLHNYRVQRLNEQGKFLGRPCQYFLTTMKYGMASGSMTSKNKDCVDQKINLSKDIQAEPILAGYRGLFSDTDIKKMARELKKMSGLSLYTHREMLMNFDTEKLMAQIKKIDPNYKTQLNKPTFSETKVISFNQKSIDSKIFDLPAGYVMKK